MGRVEMTGLWSCCAGPMPTSEVFSSASLPPSGHGIVRRGRGAPASECTLHAVGGWLDGRLQKSADHEVRQELARYRENLLRLRRELANMQESAVGCRARLYSRQKHLHAAQPGVPPRERLVEFGRAEVARFCDESPLTCGWRQRPSISPHSLLRTSVS